jgi:hypothetical protein
MAQSTLKEGIPGDDYMALDLGKYKTVACDYKGEWATPVYGGADDAQSVARSDCRSRTAASSD